MKIPIRISPAFFITAGLIGFINSFNLLGTLIWIGIIFISVLVHELGHALTARIFGQQARIELVAFGGLTIPEGAKLKLWKEFVMVFMGPFFGFMLFVIASIILLSPIQNPLIRGVLQTFRFVNLFWTAINLLPIIPLDGGQLVRIILEGIFGAKAWRISLVLSVAIASIFGFGFFLIGFFLIGAIFLIFAFQSFETLRRLANFGEADQNGENREKLKEIEFQMERGEFETSKRGLEVLISETKAGMINLIAKQYLAKIFYEENRVQDVYNLLKDHERNLTSDGKCLLYMSAYQVGDHQRVIRLSGAAFQQMQSPEIAIYAAASHSALKDVFHSIQWLKTASTFEGISIQEIIRDTSFDHIRTDPSFQNFLKNEKN